VYLYVLYSLFNRELSHLFGLCIIIPTLTFLNNIIFHVHNNDEKIKNKFHDITLHEQLHLHFLPFYFVISDLYSLK
jgi:hypothetical protein